jgi:hypothetical protein
LHTYGVAFAKVKIDYHSHLNSLIWSTNKPTDLLWVTPY